MFPSTSTPFPFDTNTTILTPKQQTLAPPFSFLHFPPVPPPSFEDQEIFLPQPPYHHHHHHHHHHDLFLLHHHQEDQSQSQSPCVVEANNGSMEGPKKKSTTDEHEDEVDEQIPGGGGRSSKIRSCKRDRHSKIKTARGLRDRRMRLSLEVARRFFGLQDMLGFDKASKTVEWLLNHSKDEIKQLAIEKINHHHHHHHGGGDEASGGGGGRVKSASSTNSECEGVSGLDEVAFISSGEVPLLVKRSSRATKASRRSSSALLHPIIGRESREKARERARERTKEKEKMKSRKLLLEAAVADETATAATTTTTTTTTTNHINNNLTQFGSWNPFETGESQESGKVNPSLDVMPEPQAQQPQRRSSQAKDDDSLVINMSKWSPSMIFSSFNNSAFPQEHQFAEFQSLAKLWEAYNNHMI